jgi:hypothetical protein
MAKISTYVTDSSVSGGDMLIGTDVDNANATKNFTVSSLSAYIATTITNFVPYTGATGNVDLGANDLSLQSLTVNSGISLTGELFTLGSSGTLGQILKSNGPSLSPEWVDIATAIDGKLWKGSFYDSVTQTLTGGANVEVPMILGTTDTAATNGISVVSDGTHLTRITVANTGIYNLMFSAQFQNSGGTGQTVDIWLRKNGSTAAANLADTNGKVFMQGNASHVMAAWNYFIPLNAGDYIQLMWTATSTNITMVTEAATAVHPATPSIIVTLNQV